MALDESLRIPLLTLSPTSNTGRYQQLAKWVRQHRVEAILTDFNQLPTILEKAGLRVPDDVALATTTVLDTPITAGIDQNSKEIGRIGFLLLNSLIRDRATGVPAINRQSVIEGFWVDGDSLPDRRRLLWSRRATHSEPPFPMQLRDRIVAFRSISYSPSLSVVGAENCYNWDPIHYRP